MRILLWPSTYLPVVGGVQTVVHDLALYLQKHGQEIIVLTNRYPRCLKGKEVIDGISVYRKMFLSPQVELLKRGRVDLFCAALFLFPANLFYLSRLFRKFKPEIVHVHFPDAQIPFVLKLKDKLRFKLIVTLHGDDVLKWFKVQEDGKKIPLQEQSTLHNSPKQRLLLTVLQKADKVTTCSEYLLQILLSLAPFVAEKAKTIHNGVSLERLQRDKIYRHKRRYIFAYGRFVKKKGFDLLIEAFSRVMMDFPFVDLIIAGEGDEESSIRNQILTLKMDKRVFLYGRAAYEEIALLLNGCEFVVVPSRVEPFGLVALEAMAVGKNVLATRVGGLPEVLNGTNNKLVDSNVEALTNGITQWIQDAREGKLQGDSNKEKINEFYWSSVGEKYLDVYNN